MQLEDKLAILADSAKYDVACTSSGVDRRGNGTGSVYQLPSKTWIAVRICGMYFQWCGPRRGTRQAGVQRGGGHLPQLYAGWAVYFAAESAVFQRLLL